MNVRVLGSSVWKRCQEENLAPQDPSTTRLHPSRPAPVGHQRPGGRGASVQPLAAGSTSSSSPESTVATRSQIPLKLVVAGNLGDSGGVRAMLDFCKGLSLLNLSPECLPSRWTGWFSSLARGAPTQTKCSSLLSFFPPSFSSLFFSFPKSKEPQKSLRSRQSLLQL